MLTAILLGGLLGLRHASDPDHVVAIGTIVSRERRPLAAAWIGASWGIGHSFVILAVGALLVGLRVAIPERLALAMELGVAAMLIALGVANLLHLGRSGAGADSGSRPVPAGSGRAALLVRSLLVGGIHGLAGSAAVALLALAAMPSPAAALLYLAIFSLGTIAGMVAISLGIGVPLAFASHLGGARRLLVAGSGVLAVGLGLYLVYEIGVGCGLP